MHDFVNVLELPLIGQSFPPEKFLDLFLVVLGVVVLFLVYNKNIRWSSTWRTPVSPRNAWGPWPCTPESWSAWVCWSRPPVLCFTAAWFGGSSFSIELTPALIGGWGKGWPIRRRGTTCLRALAVRATHQIAITTCFVPNACPFNSSICLFSLNLNFNPNILLDNLNLSFDNFNDLNLNLILGNCGPTRIYSLDRFYRQFIFDHVLIANLHPKNPFTHIKSSTPSSHQSNPQVLLGSVSTSSPVTSFTQWSTPLSNDSPKATFMWFWPVSLTITPKPPVEPSNALFIPVFPHFHIFPVNTRSTHGHIRSSFCLFLGLILFTFTASKWTTGFLRIV